MSRIVKFAITISAIAICLVVLYVTMVSSPFSASDTGIPRFAIVAVVGLGAFIFVSIVYVYSFKSKH
jgi:hypothetical protein